jgi:Rod binding domain-containing protein
MTGPVSVGPVGAVGQPAQPPVDPEIRTAARGLEGVFLSLLVGEMLKGTEVGDGNPLYAGIATEKLGERLAEDGGIGLAALLERQLGGAR